MLSLPSSPWWLVFGVTTGAVIGLLLDRVTAWLADREEEILPPARWPAAGPSAPERAAAWPAEGSAAPDRLDKHLRHPAVVPMLGALINGLLVLAAQPGVHLLPLFYLMPLLVELAMVDLSTRRLPNLLTMPSYVVGLILLAVVAGLEGSDAALLSGLAGLVMVGLPAYVVAWFRPSALGMGDAKLLGLIGLLVASLGTDALIVAVATGLGSSGLAGLLLIVKRSGPVGRCRLVPAAPFLAFGAVLGIVVSGA